MALIGYLDKDKDIPDTEIRGQWRALDANEVKSVVNANQNALASTIQAAIDALIIGAPGALDTLNELAAALGDDANFSATVTAAMALKAPLASPTFSGVPNLPTGTVGVTQSNGDNSTKLATTAYADGKIAQTITDGVLTSAPSQNQVFDALAAKQATLVSGTTIKQVQGVSILGAGNIVLIDDAIVDGEAKAPSQNAVFDALALKATIQYVDDVVAGLDITFKPVPASVATTANITLSGEQTIDGVLTSASRVLVKNQTSQSQNGIYVSAAGSWSRSTDADADVELEGAAINITGGSTQTGSNWLQTTNNITLGGSDIVWVPLGQTTPDATTSIKGILRLYTGTGSNTDGAMDQNSTTQALALKAPLNSPTFTGTVSGITSTMVGLGNVDNTADTSKPVSTAQQTALDLKANLASPTFTGAPSLPTGTTGTTQTNGDNSTKLSTTAYADAKVAQTITSGVTTSAPSQNTVLAALNLKTGTGNFMMRVTPTGAVDGVNAVYTIPHTPVDGKDCVFKNGLLQDEGDDYSRVTSTFTFTTPPEAGSKIRINYIIL